MNRFRFRWILRFLTCRDVSVKCQFEGPGGRKGEDGGSTHAVAALAFIVLLLILVLIFLLLVIIVLLGVDLLKEAVMQKRRVTREHEGEVWEEVGSALSCSSDPPSLRDAQFPPPLRLKVPDSQQPPTQGCRQQQVQGT